MHTRIVRFLLAAGIAVAALAWASPVLASTIGFSCVSDNNAGNCTTLENQIFVEILGVGTDQVSFQLNNLGPLASSITDFYIRDEDDKLGLLAGTEFSSGVLFSETCSPSDPPGYPGFTMGFCADSDSPVAPNGVNPYEFAKFLFPLNTGFTFTDVQNELADGTLQLGVHVQAFSNGGSETGLNNPPPPTDMSPVPEPSTLWMLGTGLLFAGRNLKGRLKRRT